MSSIKISQLPAKGANLASTDLVEISEFTGTGYISKSITGQEIIDAASTGGVTNVTASAPLSSSGGTTPDISIQQADGGTDGFLSSSDFVFFTNKQEALVSGTNIKTLNGASLLGSGGLSVQPTLVSGTNIKSINGNTLLGSGDLTISSSATWGSITGTLSSQTDLNTALNARVNKTTTISINGISKDLSTASVTWPGINKVVGIISTAQTAVTGTTNDTRTASIWIPANTFSGGSGLSYALEVHARIVKTGTSGTHRLNMYINTSDTLTGATYISAHTAAAAGNLYIQQQRNFSWYNHNLTGILSTGTSYNDFQSTTLTPQNTTLTNNVGYYLIFSIQLGATIDSSVLNYAKAIVYGY